MGSDLHFVSEHTLAQSEERLCPIVVGSGGSPVAQHEQTNIECDDEEEHRPPDVAMAPDHTDDSIKDEPHRVQPAEDRFGELMIASSVPPSIDDPEAEVDWNEPPPSPVLRDIPMFGGGIISDPPSPALPLAVIDS